MNADERLAFLRQLDEHSCRNPLCSIQIKGGAAYCCAPCSAAHENGYEIHEDGPSGHSALCRARRSES